MDKYYINWLKHADKYVVREIGRLDGTGYPETLAEFKTKKEAEEYIEVLKYGNRRAKRELKPDKPYIPDWLK